MPPADYDDLNSAKATLEEQERKRQEELEKKRIEQRQDLKARNQHGYPTLKDAQERREKIAEAEWPLGPNAAAITAPYPEMPDGPPHLAQRERDQGDFQPDPPPVSNRQQSPGDLQLAPGGSMFSPAQGVVMSHNQLDHQARQREEESARDRGSQTRAADEQHRTGEMSEDRVERAALESRQEMSGTKQERQRFKVNLTEKQKEELDRIGQEMGRGGRGC